MARDGRWCGCRSGSRGRGPSDERWSATTEPRFPRKLGGTSIRPRAYSLALGPRDAGQDVAGRAVLLVQGVGGALHIALGKARAAGHADPGATRAGDGGPGRLEKALFPLNGYGYPALAKSEAGSGAGHGNCGRCGDRYGSGRPTRLPGRLARRCGFREELLAGREPAQVRGETRCEPGRGREQPGRRGESERRHQHPAPPPRSPGTPVSLEQEKKDMSSARECQRRRGCGGQQTRPHFVKIPLCEPISGARVFR